jgi:hypothetical protein
MWGDDNWGFIEIFWGDQFVEDKYNYENYDNDDNDDSSSRVRFNDVLEEDSEFFNS